LHAALFARRSLCRAVLSLCCTPLSLHAALFKTAASVREDSTRA
jgi:hypothetical protein